MQRRLQPRAWTPRRLTALACGLGGFGLGIMLLALFLSVAVVACDAAPPDAAEKLWKKLEPFTQPPEEFAGTFGPYKSPLKFDDGSIAKTPADWTRRRAEIAKTWSKRLGAWPE